MSFSPNAFGATETGFQRGVLLAAVLLLGPVSRSEAQMANNIPAPHFLASFRELKMDAKTLDYFVETNLAPIRDPRDGTFLGDMSYVRYSISPSASRRPIIFFWNGGPGSNSIPLHYGAFGPLRLENGRLKPNNATLLDVADLVFVDMMETGYGRAASVQALSRVRQDKGDALTFALFVESLLPAKEERNRPIYLIGESFGARRAALVARQLREAGLNLNGLGLISGYPLTSVLPNGDPAAMALVMSPYIALSCELASHDNACGARAKIVSLAERWTSAIKSALRGTRNNSERIILGRELKRLAGAQDNQINYDLGAIRDPEELFAAAVAKSKRGGASPGVRGQLEPSDVRYLAGALDRIWISPLVVADLNRNGGGRVGRRYLGQEVEAPGAGLAASTINSNVTWGVAPLKSPLVPDLLKPNDRLRIFIADGIFDTISPCFQSKDLAQSDLSNYSDRITQKCYYGGHMMYSDVRTAEVLASDLRAFIRLGS